MTGGDEGEDVRCGGHLSETSAGTVKGRVSGVVQACSRAQGTYGWGPWCEVIYWSVSTFRVAVCVCVPRKNELLALDHIYTAGCEFGNVQIGKNKIPDCLFGSRSLSPISIEVS